MLTYPNKKIYHFATLVFSCIVGGAFMLGSFVGGGVERYTCFDAAGFPPPPAIFYLSGRE